jgi:glycosyltransferase involved in cell wall biosynthesis
MRSDWDVLGARRIRSRIRAWKADIVHAHDARSHALAMLALIGWRHIPLIVTRRVPFTPRSVRLKYGERVSRFIAISNAVRDAMVRGGIDPARIDIVHSGISIPVTPPTPRDWRNERNWPAHAILCGVVGAMTAEKGIDSLEAISRAMSTAARDRARLVLIGGSNSGEATIGGIGAFHAGFVDEIGSAVAGLDMLWHPSKAEGLGTAVLDAMAVGVPPIAFATGGLPEVIEDSKSGILVEPGDVAAFARAAEKLIDEEPLRARLGEGARTRANAFSADQMTKGAEAVYQRVLTG